MLTKNWKGLAVLCALTLFMTAVEAQAAVISFNLRGSGGTALLSTDVAGAPGAADDNWNDVVDPGGASGPITLAAGTVVDGDGAVVSGMAFTVSDPAFGAFTAGGTPINKLLKSGYDIGGADPELSFSLTGIPLMDYDVYVYAYADQFGSRGGEVWLNGYTTGTRRSVRQLNSVAYVESTDTTAFNDPGTTQGTFVKFSTVNGDSLTLDIFAAGGDRFPIAGVQIVGEFLVPEPSTLFLAGIGLFGFGACGWRRKRHRA